MGEAGAQAQIIPPGQAAVAFGPERRIGDVARQRLVETAVPLSGTLQIKHRRIERPGPRRIDFRNGESDVSHPRRTSDWVNTLIPGATMIDAPWPDDEWNHRSIARNKGEAAGLLVTWPVLAPYLPDFT